MIWMIEVISKWSTPFGCCGCVLYVWHCPFFRAGDCFLVLNGWFFVRGQWRVLSFGWLAWKAIHRRYISVSQTGIQWIWGLKAQFLGYFERFPQCRTFRSSLKQCFLDTLLWQIHEHPGIVHRSSIQTGHGLPVAESCIARSSLVMFYIYIYK